MKTLLTSGEGFKPIGNIEYSNDIVETDIKSAKSFAGIFDGDNNFIANLYIQKKIVSENKILLGFFSNNFGTIQNFGLKNGNILLESTNSNRSIVSGISSLNNGEIINCYFSRTGFKH